MTHTRLEKEELRRAEVRPEELLDAVRAKNAPQADIVAATETVQITELDDNEGLEDEEEEQAEDAMTGGA